MPSTSSCPNSPIGQIGWVCFRTQTSLAVPSPDHLIAVMVGVYSSLLEAAPTISPNAVSTQIAKSVQQPRSADARPTTVYNMAKSRRHLPQRPTATPILARKHNRTFPLRQATRPTRKSLDSKAPDLLGVRRAIGSVDGAAQHA